MGVLAWSCGTALAATHAPCIPPSAPGAPLAVAAAPCLLQQCRGGTVLVSGAPLSATAATQAPASSPPSRASMAIAAVVALGGAGVLLLWRRRMHRLLAHRARAEAVAARRRAEAEDALRATERQLQRLVQSVKAIVWRRDAETRQFTFVSQEAEQLLGYAVARWTDHPDFLGEVLHPDDREWVTRHALHATAAHRDHAMEYRVMAQDGRLVWLRDLASVIVEHGEARELVGVMVDITEAKTTEAALEMAHAQALAATRAKSEFLAAMSHEIRTPMNAVIGLTDLLLDTPLASGQRHLVETVRSSGDVLLKVINDILDFSRIEAGRLEVEHTALDPEALVEEVARLMGQRAAARGLDLVAYVAADVPRDLVGDPGRTRQVLLNLVGNAIKFTDRGDVAVRVHAVDVTDARATLRVEVADTGVGIAPAAQARLFEAFTQADASTTRRFGGTGLGLAISRGLVELLGGRLGVESAVGAGATFWFTLPCDRAGGAAVPVMVTPPHDTRVLVVDDSPASRSMLAQVLGDAGLSVEVAASADEAAELLATGPAPHVMLLDESLGVDVLRVVDALGAGSAPPVGLLLLSPRLAGSADAGPAPTRLLKPVRRVELMDALDRVRRPPVEAPATPLEPARVGSAAVASVLVAEDNPVNQHVARLMLEHCGCRVTVVENGLQAVEAVAAGAFDLVLMDCQMPVLDGLEATRRIRHLRVPAHRVPIVALTANALAGDRERCLAAGMDDYLAKPVRREDVRQVLARHLPGHDSGTTAA